jgi:D-alanine-D-alanine ligase
MSQVRAEVRAAGESSSRTDRGGPVLVLYGADQELEGGVDREAVLGVLESVSAIEGVLRRAGRTVATAGVSDAAELIGRIEDLRPSLIVNLIESFAGRGELEASAAAVLELLGVPFTGSPALALALAQHKPLARAVLAGCGLPVAPGVTLARGALAAAQREALAGLSFPCIVKPASTDASHGIEPASVVPGPEAALARAAWVWQRYGTDALVEEYVDGREINVAIVGTAEAARCLPPSEIDFRLPPGAPAIVTYAAKWIEGSPEWGASEILCPAPLEPSVRARVEEVALAAYRLFGLRGYGRVDLRLPSSGEPVILEVNPNPDLAPSAGLANAASHMPWSYDELVLRIVSAALGCGLAGAPAAAR